MLTVQELIATLDHFWQAQGCILGLGHDVETGAGTFNPNTFFRCLGPEPFCGAFVEISRRPTDGRYGDNPNRMQLFHQYQVVFKPSPPNIQELYLKSLEAIGFHLPDHDIRFVHDDWEQPSLGASGLGWEVWRDGMEVTQFTYFQQVAGFELSPIMVELTLGIERLAMTLQGVDTVWDLKWNDILTYRDIYHKGEVEWCTYNFEVADTTTLRSHYQDYAREAERLAKLGLPYPAYDFVMKASHTFNVLEARGVVSVPERISTLSHIRKIAKLSASAFIKERENLGFPLLNRWPEKTYQQKEIKEKPAPDAPNKSAPFVLEIGSEELPALYFPKALESLKRHLEKFLKDQEIPYESCNTYGSSRRLAAIIEGLPFSKPAQEIEKRGPPLKIAFDESGAPTKAGAGFFRTLGLEPQHRDALDGVEIRSDYLYGLLTLPPQKTADLLSGALPEIILHLEFPKRMRWGIGNTFFARPLHWMVALHGKWVVPFSVGDISSGRTTYGHRQRAEGPISLSAASDYLSSLHKHKVIVDPEARKEEILTQLAKIEQETKGEALAIDRLLPQLIYLSEWPELDTATFDPAFLEMPQEVAISEMVEHQKYIPLVDPDGKLLTRFVICVDNTPNDTIRKGNEKVLAARLSDGAFLFKQDSKVPFETFNEKLKVITFHEGLGSLHDKVERMVQYAKILNDTLKISNLAEVEMAALYSKADLASFLVSEFPELQGKIGHAYALLQGLPEAVACAIDEHWMPRGEKGSLPASPAGIVLSLADKIDNLLACFSIGKIPSSSSDPFALRRQVLAMIRIAIYHKLSFPLKEMLTTCFVNFNKQIERPEDPDVIPAILNFFQSRIRTVFETYGFSKPQIESALSHGVADLYDSYLRVLALHKAQKESEAFPLLAEVYKRAKGILSDQTGPFDLEKAIEPAEKALAEKFIAVQAETLMAIDKRDYEKAYALIGQLQPPLHTFFDEVRVICDDNTLKENRLALIGQVFALFDKLLDFSKLHFE